MIYDGIELFIKQKIMLLQTIFCRFCSEAAINIQFNRSMRVDNKKRKSLNAPIAKYDVAKKDAYFEYPDGRIIYAKNHSI